MSTKIIIACDRCGNDVRPNCENKEFKYKWVISNQGEIQTKTYDFCYHCHEAFERFMKEYKK